MAADVDRMRVVALWLVATVEYGLAELENALTRVKWRRFLAEHPDVTLYYPDGERQ